jgi:hypothetical protein
MDMKEEIASLTETLAKQRDEIKLKIHLGKMEVKDEWENAEKKWDHFRSKSAEIGSASKDAAADVGVALKLLGEELGHAYTKIRKHL